MSNVLATVHCNVINPGWHVRLVSRVINIVRERGYPQLRFGVVSYPAYRGVGGIAALPTIAYLETSFLTRTRQGNEIRLSSSSH